MTRVALAAVAIVFACTSFLVADDNDGWVTLFDGESFDGWKINENKDSWKIEDGAIVACGPRSHLFYVGGDKPFVNFEFCAEVMTKPESNSGIYFHTKYQESDWPKFGFEAQVNNTHRDPKKTGSLYEVVNVFEAPAKDNQWFQYCIRVEGKRIVIKVDDQVVVDYTEPENKEPGERFTRVLDKGTFALQAHDPDSIVMYRKLRVRRLP